MNQENNSESEKPNNTLAVWALVCSILCSLAGLVLGIIGLNKYPKESNGRVMCIIAVVLSILSMMGMIAWRS